MSELKHRHIKIDGSNLPYFVFNLFLKISIYLILKTVSRITVTFSQAIQIYIDNEGSGGKKSPPLNDIEDLSDTRILLRLINSIFPQTFTPEVLLNDRFASLGYPGHFVGDLKFRVVLFQLLTLFRY